ncbi:MAG: class I SAM-dependent methyltransferase [Gemmatimonadaceae bacterium]|nr:class I SAM-dependent methyltransferase [Gemmatimonadaceae bacterium]
MTLASCAALVEELERRYVVETEMVTVGAHAVELIRPRSAEELISEEDFARDERLPYWAALWPSAHPLAARVMEEHGAGRSLLELGCGLGLVTIAAMRAGFAVLATDYYDDALRFTRANAWRALGREPETRHVNWRDLPSDLGVFDRVVAADVLYERPYGELVAGVLARTLAPDGLALIADPGRVAVEAFLAACGARGLEVRETEERPYAAGNVRQTIRIYAIARIAI